MTSTAHHGHQAAPVNAAPAPRKKEFVQIGPFEDFMLGGIAAGLSKTIAAPIERVKLLIQNQGEMLKRGTLTEPYKGIGECFSRTIKNEGVVSLWRGNLANVMRYFPTQALNFAFKGRINKLLPVKRDDPFVKRLSYNMAAGGLAGALSLCVVYSLDYARTRLANDLKGAKKGAGERQYNGLLDVYKKTYAADGFVGLYRGFCVSCVGIVVYRGLYFGLFDTIRPMMLRVLPDSVKKSEMLKGLASFCVGYVVTVVAGLASYPLDTIRRRMMMTSGTGEHYKSSFHCASVIIKKEGVPYLFKGAGANILRGIAGALVLTFFEPLQKLYVSARGGDPSTVKVQGGG